MKDKLIEAITKVSEADLITATERWIGMGMRGEACLEKFMRFLEEYAPYEGEPPPHQEEGNG